MDASARLAQRTAVLPIVPFAVLRVAVPSHVARSPARRVAVRRCSVRRRITVILSGVRSLKAEARLPVLVLAATGQERKTVGEIRQDVLPGPNTSTEDHDLRHQGGVLLGGRAELSSAAAPRS